MNLQEEVPLNYGDEITLYDILKVIVKRKGIIIGFVFVPIVIAVLITFNMPKIYRGKAIINVAVKDSTKDNAKNSAVVREIVSVVGVMDNVEKVLIFPKTYKSIDSFKLILLKDTADKLYVTIDSRNAEEIPNAVSELIEYLRNNSAIQGIVFMEKERLIKELEVLLKTIDSSEESLKIYRKLLDSGRLNIIGFNPVDMNKSLSGIKLEKLNIEHALENLKGVELAGQPSVSKKPIKPKMALTISIAGIVGFLAGMAIVFLMDFALTRNESRENCK